MRPTSSARTPSDGSWPIDTNLATWVTTLSVNALAAAGDLDAIDSPELMLDWLLQQQYRTRHPYTGANPGGWAWTELPGGAPDCDDTPGATLAIVEFVPNEDRVSPPMAASFVIQMLGGTEAGDAYTFAELSGMVTKAGFRESSQQPLAPTPQTLVLAKA